MVPVRLNRTRKLLLILSAVVLVGGMGFVSWTDVRAVREMEARMEGVRGEISRATSAIRRIPAVEDRVLTLREVVQEHVRILPNDAEIHEFVDRITEFAATAGVRITALDDVGARRRTRGPAKETFDRVVVKLSLSSTLPQFLAFVDQFETYRRFVKISQFDIKAETSGGRRDGEDGPRRHKINMEIETYVYEPRAKGAGPVRIPEEAKKLERLLAGGPLTSDLQLATYRYEPKSDRRDPFADPRRRMGGDGSDVDPAEAARQKELVDRLEKELAEVKRLGEAEAKIENIVQRVQAAEVTNERLSALLAAVADAEESVTLAEPKTRLENGIRGPLTALAEARSLNAEAATATTRQLEEKRDALLALVAKEKYREAFDFWTKLSKGKMTRTGDDALGKLLAEIDQAGHLSEAHVEFEKRSLKLGGVIYSFDHPERSAVIVNGRPFIPGESVDDETKVRTITPDAVVFDFRGFEIRRRL